MIAFKASMLAALLVTRTFSSSFGQCCTGRRWTECQHNVNCGTDVPTGDYKSSIFDFYCLPFLSKRRYECATNCGCKDCPNGQYETKAPFDTTKQHSYACGTQENPKTCTRTIITAFNDRQCSPHSNCNSGTHATKPPTATSNRQCAACPPGTFTDFPNQNVCSPHKKCGNGESISPAALATTDRICSVCPDDTYQDSTNHQEVACKKQPLCGSGQKYVDRGKTQAASCEPCTAGTFQSMESHRTRCISHSKCDVTKGQSTAVDPTPTSDRICATSRECTEYQYETLPLTPTSARQCGQLSLCSNGEYVAADPTPTSDRTCADCDGEVEYSNRTNSGNCIPHDTCAKGEYVAIPGSRTKPLTCHACAEGQWQSLSGRRPATCSQQPRCAKGEKLVRADISREGYCGTCDAGQYVEDDNHRDASCAQQPFCNENEFLEGAGIASKGVCAECPAGSEQLERNTRKPACTLIVYTDINSVTNTSEVQDVGGKATPPDFDTGDSGKTRRESNATVTVVVVLVVLLVLAASIGVVVHFWKHAVAEARQHNGGVAEIEEADEQRNTMSMVENPLATARRAKAAAAEPQAAEAQDVALDARPTNTVFNAMFSAQAASGLSSATVYAVPMEGATEFSGPHHATIDATATGANAFEAPDYATIDGINYTAYLAAFAGGNEMAIYSSLAEFGQIPSSGGVYASVIERFESETGGLYSTAAVHQLETAKREIYLETSASKLTAMQKSARLAKMARAMSVHQGKYDILFAKWTGAPWIEDLEMQHTDLVLNIAAEQDAVLVQPNPWINGPAVTSKRYMLKLLEVYNQTDAAAPVPTVVAACRRIAAKFSVEAVTFISGPTKTQIRIFEKVLIHNGRFDCIRDYARATFVVKNLAVFPRLLQMLLIDDAFKVIRAKNRLSTTWDTRDSAGYRDYQVLVQTKDGWILELQLIPQAMHTLKKQLGHADYVQYRFIVEAGQRARAFSAKMIDSSATDSGV